MAQDQKPLYGHLPSFEPVSEFIAGEVISSALKVSQDIIKLDVTRTLFNRKLYGWIWAANSAADYYLKAEFAFFANGNLAGKLPLAVANASVGGTVFAQSIATVCITQSTAVQDSIGIFPTNPAAGQPASLVLQPLYISGEFDQIRVSVLDAKNVTTWRVYAAVISSK